MPMVRVPHDSYGPPTSPRITPSSSRTTRARSASTSHSLSDLFSPPQPAPPPDTASEWIGIPLKFDIVQEHIEIPEYQMYAVEKWIVERNRPVTVLNVYTGDPDHKITVTALSPSTSLSPADAQAEWEKALHHLRRDGARPKQTPYGVLMATSLAHFRSDYTIVHIPHGNFLVAKEQLYTNINLLRMGCSGRSALTLEEPSDTTKDRFISTYHLPDTTFCQSSLPAPTSSEYLPLPGVPLSKQNSNASTDAPLKSPPNSPRHRQHVSLHKQRSREERSPSKPPSISKAAANIGLGRPSIHVIGPSPTSSFIGSPNGNGNANEKAALSPNPSSTSLSTSPKQKDKDRDKDKDKSNVSSTKSKTKDRVLFNATVLELVKLIQAGLAIFGMYGARELGTGVPAMVLDGLLCDVTVDGIRKWITDIGEPCVGLEPMERIADPMFISALLSLVLSIRNKLAALGYGQIVPIDPFLHPHTFSFTLTAYIQSTSNSPPVSSGPLSSGAGSTTSSISHSHQGHGFGHANSMYTFSYPHFPVYTPFASHSSGPFAGSAASSVTQVTSSVAGAPVPVSTIPPPTVLTRDLVESIESAYDAKTRPGEGRKVRRALKGKLGDLTNAVANGVGAGLDGDEDGPNRERRGTTASAGEGAGGAAGRMIGGLADGLRRVAGGGGPGEVLEGTVDLAGLVGVFSAREGLARGKRRSKDRRRESVDLGIVGLGYGGRGEKDKHRDMQIASSVKGLWCGRVADVARMREWEAEKERETFFGNGEPGSKKMHRGSERWRREKLALGVGSDGDVEERGTKSDGRSTEEESDAFGGNGFGGMWGGKVQKKLESWAGLSRKKGLSLDLSPAVLAKSKGKPMAGSNEPSMSRRSSVRTPGTGPQSPTLPPIVFAGDVDRDPDDEDFLSSGQVSPLSDYRPNPFNMLNEAPSIGSSTTNLNSINSVDYEHPISARDDLLDEIDGDSLDDTGNSDTPDGRRSTKGKSRERDRLQSLLSIGSLAEEDEEAQLAEEPAEIDYNESDWEDAPRKRSMSSEPQRRRSFHELDSLRDMDILPLEHMRIDVELCGQVLIMIRREQHLQNVVECLQVLTASLSQTNAELREDYHSNLTHLTELESRTKVLAEIDAEYIKADKTSQATNTLCYESEQFRIADLWQAASPSRSKVFGLREKVFGTGGRRLPQGVHGAHGRFNRLQWTIDGQQRLVDHLGRTESEAEEEIRVDPESILLPPPIEDEEDVVEHPGIKPMWLLRFFTRWGAKWSAAATITKEKEDNGKGPIVSGSIKEISETESPAPNGSRKTSSSGPEDAVDDRLIPSPSPPLLSS
ncbi:hypothetical protein BDQ12DRAFT_622506 [Crucibulum laeve]|uniref:STB6-like N-terminal domain-containing protein n=1 Tax=Crucibulum laeve TaxID=68775 RepID=A0A5C3MDV7_9AGAR|nr:hypothetical protein BDQ12DRAFT_622506 [Crucibulum laeve]